MAQSQNIFQQIFHLIIKELKLEWRQKYAFNGLLLYVSSTVFVVYMAFLQMKPTTWIAVLWIILLFASANAIAKSFLQENHQRQLYYFTIAEPQAIILSKIIYNIILLLVIALLGVGSYSLFLGSPVVNFPLFILAVFLGALSFSMTFTMVSAISAKAGGNATLMPILSFPIIIPVISLLIAISTDSLTPDNDLNLNRNIGILLAINVIVFALSHVLFPYLWKD